MTFTSRRTALFGSLALLVGSAMLCSAKALPAAPPAEIEEPAGLVWFIGTVEQVVEGVPTIDLGEVHTLRRADQAASFKSRKGANDSTPDLRLPAECTVATIRYSDNHFTPLGVMEVSFSNPTWCQMKKPASFTSEVGDLVMFVAAPGNLGSGDAIRDSFIRHRIVSNSSGNRYSTVRELVEADTLQRVMERQPSWVEGKRRIAGVIRSPSVTKQMHTRLKPFVNQIMAFQEYQDRGVDVAQVTSEAWASVLEKLRYTKESTDTNIKEIDGDAVAQPIVTENTVDPGKLITVRRLVDESMFQRFPEERNTMAVICATLLYTKTSNERQWIAQQFAKSQFPGLGRQEQALIDMEAIMRRVRQTE
ncbi:MAG: hypothetical protein H7Z17_21395 [Fuerstia sp.]|nr:hypothetical protein [Fuerstiella sp.]